MADPAMNIGENELKQIGEYVKSNLRDWLGEMSPSTDAVTSTSLLERAINVEHELKAQREVMLVKFETVDQRFEDMIELVEARFEAVDRRFEAVDRRFEAVDRRFKDLVELFEARFNAVDRRFEAVDQRFEDVNRRFEDMNKRFTSIQWLIGVGFLMLGTLVTVFGLLG